MDQVPFDELELLFLLPFLEELSLHDLHLPRILLLVAAAAVAAPHLAAHFDDQVVQLSLLGFELPVADL